ncbi:MAG TPA: 6-phosphogluconolactonase [Thermoanaerobaculia bacterium]|jgi:6-phosphogluconolactonase|nr:6-phosphogluconolactonase [Thermoanaerobaculia bacterium]
MNQRIFDNYEDLSQSAARAIRQSGAKSIAVTGGSTPKRLYEILGASLPQDVTWVLLDERFVPHDDAQSNAAMVERTLFRDVIPERWLRFDTSLPDAAASARAFEAQWDVGTLDLVLLGCGDDGHTASLFPGTPVLDVEDRVASEVYVPRLEQWRVTLTLPVIRAAKMRMVLVSGPTKGPILEEVRQGTDYPVVRATSGVDSWWYIAP